MLKSALVGTLTQFDKTADPERIQQIGITLYSIAIKSRRRPLTGKLDENIFD